MHAFKFKRYKIKWNSKKRKFFKKKKNRQKSRKAYLRWKKNKAVMKKALRRSKAKRKRSMRRNKARGIYKKLKIARKRWKSLLKHDVDTDNILNLLFEKETERAEIPLEPEDIEGIKQALEDLRDNLEFDDEDTFEVIQFVDDSEELLNDIGGDELEEEDIETLEDIIDIIDNYAEQAGIYNDDDEDNEEDNEG
jgi:hypothetical protein